MRVKRSGKSVNAFITTAIFSGDVPRAQRTPPVEREMLAKLLFQAAQIRDELRVIAERDGGQQSLIDGHRNGDIHELQLF